MASIATTVGFLDAMVTYETAKENYSINSERHLCNGGSSYAECLRAKELHSKCITQYESKRPYNEDYEVELSKWGPTFEKHARRSVAENANNNAEYLARHIAGRALHVNCEAPIPVSGPASLLWWTCCALIEVKTRITAIGDLLRQMNLYREYKNHHGHDRLNGGHVGISDYVVWSLDPADSKYTKLLSQQGYTLIAGPLP